MDEPPPLFTFLWNRKDAGWRVIVERIKGMDMPRFVEELAKTKPNIRTAIVERFLEEFGNKMYLGDPQQRHNNTEMLFRFAIRLRESRVASAVVLASKTEKIRFFEYALSEPYGEATALRILHNPELANHFNSALARIAIIRYWTSALDFGHVKIAREMEANARNMGQWDVRTITKHLIAFDTMRNILLLDDADVIRYALEILMANNRVEAVDVYFNSVLIYCSLDVFRIIWEKEIVPLFPQDIEPVVERMLNILARQPRLDQTTASFMQFLFSKSKHRAASSALQYIFKPLVSKACEMNDAPLLIWMCREDVFLRLSAMDHEKLFEQCVRYRSLAAFRVLIEFCNFAPSQSVVNTILMYDFHEAATFVFEANALPQHIHFSVVAVQRCIRENQVALFQRIWPLMRHQYSESAELFLFAIQLNRHEIVRFIMDSEDYSVLPLGPIRDQAALRMAAAKGYAETVQALLTNKNVDPTIHDNKPLKDAITNGRANVVHVLLQDERIGPHVPHQLLESWIRSAHQFGHRALAEELESFRRHGYRPMPQLDFRNRLIALIARDDLEGVIGLLGDASDTEKQEAYRIALGYGPNAPRTLLFLIQQQTVDVLANEGIAFKIFARNNMFDHLWTLLQRVQISYLRAYRSKLTIKHFENFMETLAVARNKDRRILELAQRLFDMTLVFLSESEQVENGPIQIVVPLANANLPEILELYLQKRHIPESLVTVLNQIAATTPHEAIRDVITRNLTRIKRARQG